MPEQKSISLALLGFYDPLERHEVAALFNHSHQWQRPWKIVDNADKAEFFLVASEYSTTEQHKLDAYQQKYHFDRQRTITYGDEPDKKAQWHLQRPTDAKRPSPLEFALLLKKITGVYAADPTIPVSVIDPVTSKSSHEAPDKQKLLIVGSVGSGKSCAINTLTQGCCISTEATPSDQASLTKSSTTVAMDFGTCCLDDKSLRIYGSPGQRRFDFMGDILLKNAKGLIIMTDNRLSDSFSELSYYLDTYHDFLCKYPAVIGITHSDLSPSPSIKEYTNFLQSRNEKWPAFKVDARCYDDMKKLVEALLNQQKILIKCL